MPSPRQCPVSEPSRLALEEGFPVVTDMFGKENIRSRKVLLPTPADFPIRYDGSIQAARDTMHIVAAQMEIPSGDIQLNVYEEGKSLPGTPGPFNSIIPLAIYKKISASGGADWSRQDDGKFHLWLEIGSLTRPELLVAALAYKIAHIKLWGEGRTDQHHGFLADLAITAFGLGVFNANESYKEYKGYNGWHYTHGGYLRQREWGYALALFAQLREEKDPAWAKHLTANIRSDFSKSQAYLEEIG